MLKFTGDYIEFFGGIQMVYFTKKAWDKLARKFVAVRINPREEPSKMYNLFAYRSVLGKAHKALENDGYMKKNIDKTVSFYEMTGEKSAPNKDNVYFFGVSDAKLFAAKFAKILEREGLVFVGLKETTGWQALILTYKEYEDAHFDVEWTNGIVSFVDNQDQKVKPKDWIDLQYLSKEFAKFKANQIILY